MRNETKLLLICQKILVELASHHIDVVHPFALPLSLA